MPLPTRRPQRSRSLVASAYRVGERDTDYQRRQTMGWQTRALEYCRIVPELNFASRFYSRMLKQLRIYPAKLGEHDEKKEIRSGPPVEVLNRIQDPGGGRSQILRNYGRLMFATGEGLLFGRSLGSETEKWTFIWNEELRVETFSDGKPRKFFHKVGGGKEIEYGPEEAIAYRMWTPDPGMSWQAEAPMQAALEIAEELIILTKSVRATATTRLLNGLLFLPVEALPPVEEIQGGSEDPESDPWTSDFIEHVSTQIENPGTAEAKVPLISWLAGEHIPNIRHLQLHDPQTDYMERDLRKEAIDRLAWGLDMPPEALKGLGDTNHWAAMQILGDMWKSHGAPLAEQFCDEISSAYLQPALKDEGFAEWDKIVAHYDASQITVKPDRSEDADNAAKYAMISPRGYRQLKNIPEDLAPSEEERLQILEVLGRSPQKAQRVEEQSPNGNDPARDGPPLPGAEGDSGRRTRVVTSAAAAYEAMGAAMMALARCRELAGIRLWQKQRTCPDCFEKADGLPHSLVASALGPGIVQQVGWDPLRLVRGGADTLQDMLVYWDYSPKQAQALAELIESFAARTLYDERLPQLPSGFAAHLERAKELDSAVGH